MEIDVYSQLTEHGRTWTVIEVSTFLQKINNGLVRAKEKIVAAQRCEIDQISVSLDVCLPRQPFLRARDVQLQST